MADIPITLTAADYARLMPLALGQVRPQGIALTLELGREGSWPARAEMLRRALNDPGVQGGEASMAGHLRRIADGDRSHVALPVFPLRNFTARDLYVRKDGPIRTPADLNGARIGMYSWVASGSVWYRHFLRHIGVDLGSVRWWVGNIDGPWASAQTEGLPEFVRPPPEGSSLARMLIAGELDALYSPPRPDAYDPVRGPIVRLFPDFRGIEREYFQRHRILPPQHLVVLRRAAWERAPWIARSLTDAFVRNNEAFALAQRRFPYASPWLEAELEETAALMGEDFYPDGLEKNRHALEVFVEQARQAGLIPRPVSVEEYFQEYLASPAP